MLPSLILISTALAHKPTLGSGFGSAESAHLVEDPNISIVVYQQLTCEQEQLWLSYDAEEDFELFVQLGVPVIDRFENYAPSVALLHPGLPPVELPFELPDGLDGIGGIIFDAGESSDFNEPFTQTDSWILVEERIVLPQSGTGYIVAWDPKGWTGKLWLATGEVEDFSDVSVEEFVIWMEVVNNFHETGRYEMPPVIVEEDCAAYPSTEKGGCAAFPRLILLPLVRRFT